MENEKGHNLRKIRTEAAEPPLKRPRSQENASKITQNLDESPNVVHSIPSTSEHNVYHNLPEVY